MCDHSHVSQDSHTTESTIKDSRSHFEMLQSLSKALWSEDLWLPPNTKWTDVAPSPGKPYTDHGHLLLAIPMALVLDELRSVLIKCLFVPLGTALGIKYERSPKPSPNPKLEAAYAANADSKMMYRQEHQIQRWLQYKPSTLVMFCESCWRASFLLYNFLFGLWVLWDKEWLWDPDYCYIDYLRQGITNDIWWYYMVALSFYWSQTLTLYMEVHRKDFWQHVAHHAATLVLLACSWLCNLHRVGTLVMLSHDSSETILEMTKAVRYAGYHKTSNYMFSAFTALWIVTRMGIYPYYIVGGATFRLPYYIPSFPALRLLVYLLWVLLVLNVYWTVLILEFAYKTMRSGQTQGDVRSSSSEDCNGPN